VRIEGKVLIDGEEVGQFSVGFDEVVMMTLNGGRWSPSWVFEWASQQGKTIELVPNKM
jgi:hypothetical protein